MFDEHNNRTTIVYNTPSLFCSANTKDAWPTMPRFKSQIALDNVAIFARATRITSFERCLRCHDVAETRYASLTTQRRLCDTAKPLTHPSQSQQNTHQPFSTHHSHTTKTSHPFVTWELKTQQLPLTHTPNGSLPKSTACNFHTSNMEHHAPSH